MTVRQSKEPDKELAQRIAHDGCILRSVVGSTVHGLSNPGTDDRDEMGVCIEPRQYVLGLRPFEHWVYRTQPEGMPSGPGDLDLTVYVLRKFCTLASKGSPTVLLLLFVDGEHVVTRTRELSTEHGYDTKYAMHALRIAVQGIELLTSGRVSLPVPEPDRSRLMAVRRGEPDLATVIDELDAATATLERVIKESDLPTRADARRIDEFLVSAYERHWAQTD